MATPARRRAPTKERTAAGKTGELRALRRAQIVAAARALVAAGGLSALTFGALEQRLGYSRGVLTYHFADKDEIVAALLQSAVAEIDDATTEKLGATATLEEAVRAVLRTKVDGFLGHQEAAEILIAFWSRPHGGGGRDRTASLFSGYRAQSAALVRAARKADPRCRADPAAMAALLVGIVIGLVVQLRFDPDSVAVEPVLEEAAQTLLSRLRPR